MTKTLIDNWWLLALCGVLDAAFSATNFFTQRADGHLALRTSVDYRSTLVQMGILAIAAGACTIVAGVWRSQDSKSWLLVLNGLACSALGLILTFWTGKLAFRTVACLIIAMALGIGIYQLAAARTLRHHLTDAWFPGLAGVGSVGFALVFSALGFGWIKLNPESPTQTLFWIGSYFAFSAIGMLGLVLRQPGWRESLPTLGDPKHAH